MFEGKIGGEVECFARHLVMDSACRLGSELGWENGCDGSIEEGTGTEAVEFRTKVYKIDEVGQFGEDASKIISLISVNKSCGLHFHISFKDNINYLKLANWNFITFFQEKYKSTFKSKIETSRINNHYCKFYTSENDFKSRTNAQLAVSGKSGDRYSSVNFNSYNFLGTVEFRLFPATSNPKTFKKYMNFLVNTVNEYLEANSYTGLQAVLPRPAPSQPVKIIERI